MLHVQIIVYIALYSVSVSNCRISRWIQPPEQRKTAEFSAAVTKKSSFLFCLFVLQKDVYSFLQCSRTTFRCTYCILFLKNSCCWNPKFNKVWKLTPNWQGSPFFPQILYYILLCMLFLMNSFAHTQTHTHTHTEIFKPLLLRFPKTWMVNLAPLCKWWPHCGPCF